MEGILRFFDNLRPCALSLANDVIDIRAAQDIVPYAASGRADRMLGQAGITCKIILRSNCEFQIAREIEEYDRAMLEVAPDDTLSRQTKSTAITLGAAVHQQARACHAIVAITSANVPS